MPAAKGRGRVLLAHQYQGGRDVEGLRQHRAGVGVQSRRFSDGLLCGKRGTACEIVWTVRWNDPTNPKRWPEACHRVPMEREFQFQGAGGLVERSLSGKADRAEERV